MAEVEDPPQVRRHGEAVHQAPARDRVAHAVDRQRPPALLLEAVLVDPQAVGAAALLVDETVGGSQAVISLRQRIGTPLTFRR